MSKMGVRLRTVARVDEDETLNGWLTRNVGHQGVDWRYHVIMMAPFLLFERDSDGMLFKLAFGDKYRVEILDDDDTNWLDAYGKA